MRTTVTLDDDVFEAIQALSQASGERLGKVLSQVARRGLTSSGSATNRHGLPVFEVAADAPVIPSSRARDLMAEEAP